MTSPEKQKKLESLSLQQKKDRVKLLAYKKRGTLIHVYRYRYLTENEYPHDDRGEVQYVLRNRKEQPL